MRSYFSFNKTERRGLSLLLSLILLVLALRIGVSYLQQPELPADQELQLAWGSLQQQAMDAPATPASLFHFDPNTVDSSGMIGLGLSPKTAHMLIRWRASGKRFYKKEDLKALYTLKETDYLRLEPYIRIAPQVRGDTQKNNYYSRYPELPPLPDKISLNHTDSATLVRLQGIGPYLAHKIIERRAALGGFLKPEQLLEIHRFPDTVFSYLKEHLVVNAGEIKPIALNSVSGERLAAHPYIGAQMASNILLLRKGLHQFEQIAQLRQVPLMNEEKYRKIAPYCIID